MLRRHPLVAMVKPTYYRYGNQPAQTIDLETFLVGNGGIAIQSLMGSVRVVIVLDKLQRQQLEYKKSMRDWEHSKKGIGQPSEPDEPILAEYLCGNTTTEALTKALLHNPRGILVTRDELSGWLGGIDEYKKGGGGDTSIWLEVFGARMLKINRKSENVVCIPRAAASITGGIQPETLKRSLSGMAHVEDGLLARFLLVMPPEVEQVWTEAEITKASKDIMAMVFDKLLGLDFDLDKDGEPVPKDLPLTPDAKNRFRDFYNEHAKAIHQEQSGALRAAFSKIQGYAGRLALAIHCVRCALNEPGTDPKEIDDTSMQAGIDLALWFRHETARIYKMLEIGDDDGGDDPQSALIRLIRDRGGKITVRDLMRCCWRYRDDLAQAQSDLEALVKKGLGRWTYPASGKNGGRPSQVFELLKETSPDTSTKPPTAEPK